MSSREKAISFMINLRSCYGRSSFLFFSFFLNDGTTGIGEENCASLHVSKNRDNFQVSWTWTHSVKFPAIKKVMAADCAISKKRKRQLSSDYSYFFTHNGITTPKTTREGQESTTKTSLHLAWPPKFKNQVLFTPRAQSRFLDLGLLLRGCRPKSRSLPGRVEVIQPVVRVCTTFWLTSTRITLTRVHRYLYMHYVRWRCTRCRSVLTKRPRVRLGRSVRSDLQLVRGPWQTTTRAVAWDVEETYSTTGCTITTRWFLSVHQQVCLRKAAAVDRCYSAFSFFSKTLFDFKKSILAWLSSNFQERLLMKYFMPQFIFGVSIFSLRA